MVLTSVNLVQYDSSDLVFLAATSAMPQCSAAVMIASKLSSSWHPVPVPKNQGRGEVPTIVRQQEKDWNGTFSSAGVLAMQTSKRCPLAEENKKSKATSMGSTHNLGYEKKGAGDIAASKRKGFWNEE